MHVEYAMVIFDVYHYYIYAVNIWVIRDIQLWTRIFGFCIFDSAVHQSFVCFQSS